MCPCLSAHTFIQHIRLRRVPVDRTGSLFSVTPPQSTLYSRLLWCSLLFCKLHDNIFPWLHLYMYQLKYYAYAYKKLVYISAPYLLVIYTCLNNSSCSQVNFLQMPVNTLRRYKRHFKLQTKPGLNKSQLSEVVFPLTC